MSTRAEDVASQDRAWLARALLVLVDPRPVFAALRDDSDDAARARQAFLRGIPVRERAPVIGIEGDGRVRLDGTTIEAQAVVVTAGAWVAPLLEPLGISPPVTPTRESVAYFAVEAQDGLPTIIDWRLAEGYDLPRGGESMYALPTPEGLKVGRLGADIIGTRSDYGPFRDRRVPFLFFSTGQHPDYHSPRDLPDRLDYEKLRRISVWIAALTDRLVNDDDGLSEGVERLHLTGDPAKLVAWNKELTGKPIRKMLNERSRVERWRPRRRRASPCS